MTIVDPADVGHDASEYVITPHDTDVLKPVPDAIHVDVGGTLTTQIVIGVSVTRTVAAGWHPIPARRVMSTGTTATGITGIVSRKGRG